MTSGGNNFNDFPENQLTKFRAVFNSQGKSGPTTCYFVQSKISSLFSTVNMIGLNSDTARK